MLYFPIFGGDMNLALNGHALIPTVYGISLNSDVLLVRI